MNLNALSINVMLAHSAYWLSDADLRAKLAAHRIGAALLEEVTRVHRRLAGQVERRRQLVRALARFSELMAALDLTHDDMARAIHAVLEALIMATRDAQARELYIHLRDLLFPEGLSIVSRTYAYQAGAAEALAARVSETDLARLAGIPVGPETLADWYRAWIAAGTQLGEQLHQRDALLARTGRNGTAIAEVDPRAARLEWIEIVQTLLGALDIMKVEPEVREQLEAPLRASITQALRGRGSGELPPELPGDDVPGDDVPGDDAPGDDAPGDDAPGDDVPGGDVPGDDVPGDGLPGDGVPGNGAPGDDLSGAPAAGSSARAHAGDDVAHVSPIEPAPRPV